MYVCHREKTCCSIAGEEATDYIGKYDWNDYWNDDISVYREYCHEDDDNDRYRC